MCLCARPPTPAETMHPAEARVGLDSISEQFIVKKQSAHRQHHLHHQLLTTPPPTPSSLRLQKQRRSRKRTVCACDSPGLTSKLVVVFFFFFSTRFLFPLNFEWISFISNSRTTTTLPTAVFFSIQVDWTNGWFLPCDSFVWANFTSTPPPTSLLSVFLSLYDRLANHPHTHAPAHLSFSSCATFSSALFCVCVRKRERKIKRKSACVRLCVCHTHVNSFFRKQITFNSADRPPDLSLFLFLLFHRFVDIFTCTITSTPLVVWFFFFPTSQCRHRIDALGRNLIMSLVSSFNILSLYWNH